MKICNPSCFRFIALLRFALLPFGILFLAYQLPGQSQYVKEQIFVDGRLLATERSSSSAVFFTKSGNYDNDLKADLAVFRPSTGYWYIQLSGTPGGSISRQWGISTDVCVPGDYDGDRKSDIAVYRKSTGTWYVTFSSSPNSYSTTPWGASTDFAVPRDYDGDCKADLAVWRPSTHI
jgi:hypothetical protein